MKNGVKLDFDVHSVDVVLLMTRYSLWPFVDVWNHGNRQVTLHTEQENNEVWRMEFRAAV